MLINISGKNQNGNLIFNLPSLNLDLRFTYTVSVKYLHFKTTESFESDSLLCLTSNLIDCSSFNPLQALYCFKSVGNSPIQDHRPFVQDNYILHNLDIKTSIFQIKDYFRERSLELDYIFLILEIAKKDVYGRF